MRNINLIVVHCSATTPLQDIGSEEIRDWHVNENGWSDIGYHYVIRRNGFIEDGRPIEKAGAHARGYNANSIGVCYVGGINTSGEPEDNRTQLQTQSLVTLLKKLVRQFPKAKIVGHCNLPGVAKACPSFDAQDEYQFLTQGK